MRSCCFGQTVVSVSVLSGSNSTKSVCPQLFFYIVRYTFLLYTSAVVYFHIKPQSKQSVMFDFSADEIPELGSFNRHRSFQRCSSPELQVVCYSPQIHHISQHWLLPSSAWLQPPHTHLSTWCLLYSVLWEIMQNFRLMECRKTFLRILMYFLPLSLYSLCVSVSFWDLCVCCLCQKGPAGQWPLDLLPRSYRTLCVFVSMQIWYVFCKSRTVTAPNCLTFLPI